VFFGFNVFALYSYRFGGGPLTNLTWFESIINVLGILTNFFIFSSILLTPGSLKIYMFFPPMQDAYDQNQAVTQVSATITTIPRRLASFLFRL